MSASRTPTLGELFRIHGDRLFAELRVALPARVEKYYPELQCADLKPLLRDTTWGESGEEISISMPVLPRVPVIFPGAGGYRITLPIVAGDIVLAVFTDRSLDKWKSTGGEVDPIDLRQHHLSDAIAIPGVRDPQKGNAETAIEIQADGTIKLAGGSASVGRVGDAVGFESPAGPWDIFFQALAALIPAGAGTALYNAAKISAIGSISAGANKVKA